MNFMSIDRGRARSNGETFNIKPTERIRKQDLKGFVTTMGFSNIIAEQGARRRRGINNDISSGT